MSFAPESLTAAEWQRQYGSGESSDVKRYSLWRNWHMRKVVANSFEGPVVHFNDFVSWRCSVRKMCTT